MTTKKQLTDAEAVEQFGRAIRTYLDQREYRRLKMRLTRKLNAHRRQPSVTNAKAILDEVAYAYRAFGDGVWPDDWHRWSVAADDARAYVRYHR